MRVIHRVAVPVLLAVLIAAPSAVLASSPARGTAGADYVGTVGSTRAFVAVVVRGSSVIAYVCDSGKVAQWFKGTARAGKATLTSSRGYVLRVAIGSGRATGSIRFRGRAGLVHRFVAARAAKPAGLYRGVKTVGGRSYLGGWIILPDGHQRGEVISGTTNVASPTLTPGAPTAFDAKQVKHKTVVIVIIAILIG